MPDFFVDRGERTKRPVSLHQLTALDATPIELIEHAGMLGCDHVCLFTHVPAAARHVYPMVGADDVAAVRAALADAGVSVCNLEVLPLDGGPLDALRAGLATGAALGAMRATAHVHEADEPAAIARFAAFAALAAEYGIVAGLEFNAFSAVRDAASAARIVRAAESGSLVLDTLHFVRGGGDPAEVAGYADLIGYAQVSDGPITIADDQRWREAISERALPGDGALPLAALLAPLTSGTVIEVEVPQRSAQKAGVSAFDRCAQAVAATRRVLDAIG